MVLWSVLTGRTSRLILAWVLCLAAAVTAISYAWVNLADPKRVDGNGGHVNVDFAGQWMMGRLLLAGKASELYDRHAHQEVLERAYPDYAALETLTATVAPLAARSSLELAVLVAALQHAERSDEPLRDHHRLGDMLLGKRDYAALETLTATVAPLAARSSLELAVLVTALPPASELVEARRAKQLGGPLYPPIHAYVMAPLALLPPLVAYRTMQILNLVLVFLLGLGASAWSGGRIWWPVATLLLMLFPGFAGTINLGQNPLLSLALLGVGWWLVSVGRPGLGGVVWGCLAFKPVWAVTYFALALASRRWRLALSMGATGLVLILLTLPAGGLRPWFDWLAVGKIASAAYERDKSWVLLSRDVQNLPRRVLLDFPPEVGPGQSRYGSQPDVLGVGLWACVVGLWLVGLWRLSSPRFQLSSPLTHIDPRSAAEPRVPSPPGVPRGEGGQWDGPAGCFALLGAWLACWHFMYYDSLLAALPVFLLIRDPRKAGWVPWVVLFLLIGCHYLFEVVDPKFLGPPCDTLLLFGLWAWSYFKSLPGSAPRPSAGHHP
jgi:hypothetical protein